MKRLFSLSLLFALSACSLSTQAVDPSLMPSVQRQSVERSALPQMFSEQAQSVFSEHDHNHNGLIEPTEIAHAPNAFAELDQNQDGVLTPQEALPSRAHFQWLSEQVSPELSAELEPLSLNALNHLPQQTSTRPPVLLVPGYAEPSWYFLYGIFRDLRKKGFNVEGINLFPNFAPAHEQAQKLSARIEAMKVKYNTQRVDLVVHSYGGLVSRYYLQEMGGAQNVDHLVTVATPHHGTYVSYLGPGDSARQMRPGSDFLKNLNQNWRVPGVKYTSIWTNLDEIVIPPSHAKMPESNVRYVPWNGHLSILFSDKTYAFIEESLNE